MPPRNNPLPAAVRLFNCTICDKGYPRQLDYENHLRSYDHNHRQRLADMKKLTASNEGESSTKPKQSLDMRSIDVENANKKPGVGSRFKKVGVAVGGKEKEVGSEAVEAKKEEEATKAEAKIQEPVVAATAPAAVPSSQMDVNKDTIMADEDVGETITWEEYDFTKPTGCDHTSCPGCKTDGIWSGEWVAVSGT